MTNRNLGQLSCFSIMTGIIILSLGFNILQFSRIQHLQVQHKNSHYWVSPYEMHQIEKELEKLEKSAISVINK